MSKSVTYTKAKEFKRKYPLTVAWRMRKHCKVVDKLLYEKEDVKYVFLGQKNEHSLDFLNTYVIVLTNRRLIIATKRLAFGYFFTSVTPDLFNDLTIKKCLIWGRVIIDTVKEEISLSNISPRALPEIEENVLKTMMKMKRDFMRKKED